MRYLVSLALTLAVMTACSPATFDEGADNSDAEFREITIGLRRIDNLVGPIEFFISDGTDMTYWYPDTWTSLDVDQDGWQLTADIPFEIAAGDDVFVNCLYYVEGEPDAQYCTGYENDGRDSKLEMVAIDNVLQGQTYVTNGWSSVDGVADGIDAKITYNAEEGE